MKKNSTIPPGPAADRMAVFMAALVMGLFMLTMGCGSSPPDEDAEDIASRLKRLETRVAALELNNDTCDAQSQKVERFIADSERRQADFMMSISKLLEEQDETDISKVDPGETSAEDIGAVAAPPAAEAKKDDQSRPPVADTVAGQPQYHQVQKGETVYSISRLYNLEAAALKKLNGLESDVIVPGQKLRVR